MNYLFVHQFFPGQYVHLVRHLQEVGHNVIFVTQRRGREISGVRILEYLPLPPSGAIPPHLQEVESGVMNGLAVARLCEGLKREGFTPDVMIGHCGWGEVLFVKDVWPSVPLLGYFEFFYRVAGSDMDFDPEFPPASDDPTRIRVRNTINLMSLDAADWGQTPTEWQRAQYPEIHRARISVIHEGIDTDLVHPEPTARLWLRGGMSFAAGDEVITYSARNLEPYRGFHIFMRVLAKVLERRPNARAIIVGSDGVSYGRLPEQAANWREYMLNELEGRLDLRRVHFVGWLTYQQYLAVLQLSSAHVYLTYPFVLSWSLLEAMAAGCLVIGSRTPPVEEAIDGITNGYLVDFFDVDGIADRICSVLRNPGASAAVREKAREHVLAHYDMKAVSLPAHLALIRRLTGEPPAAPPARRRDASSSLRVMMSAPVSEGAAAGDPAAGIAQSAAPNAIARLVNLDPGLFAFSVTGAAPWRGADSGLALPAVHVCPFHADRDGAAEITAASGKPAAWLGGQADTLFVRSPAGGSAALVTAYLGRDPSGPLLALAIRRLDPPPDSSGIMVAELPVVTVSLATPTAPTHPQEEVGLEILLHIRGRGDVYFFERGWAGRVGAGSWVEAFAILPQHALAASAIEYKGLSASGDETAWLPSGSRCGTSGRSIPLVGFAVRQKAGVAGARFDCEYSGYFQSGTISGPARNGAPCLSAAANDPLEGLQLRIIDRSAHE